MKIEGIVTAMISECPFKHCIWQISVQRNCQKIVNRSINNMWKLVKQNKNYLSTMIQNNTLSHYLTDFVDTARCQSQWEIANTHTHKNWYISFVITIPYTLQSVSFWCDKCACHSSPLTTTMTALIIQRMCQWTNVLSSKCI